MRPVVIQVPVYAKEPKTFADYAFAWAMENEYGPLVDFVKGVPSPITNEALRHLNMYLDGFGTTKFAVDDRLEDLTLYVDNYLTPEDAEDFPHVYSVLLPMIELGALGLPSWLTYILDSYDI